MILRVEVDSLPLIFLFRLGKLAITVRQPGRLSHNSFRKTILSRSAFKLYIWVRLEAYPTRDRLNLQINLAELSLFLILKTGINLYQLQQPLRIKHLFR
jgi:hypothetical protein